MISSIASTAAPSSTLPWRCFVQTAQEAVALSTLTALAIAHYLWVSCLAFTPVASGPSDSALCSGNSVHSLVLRSAAGSETTQFTVTCTACSFVLGCVVSNSKALPPTLSLAKTYCPWSERICNQPTSPRFHVYGHPLRRCLYSGVAWLCH